MKEGGGNQAGGTFPELPPRQLDSNDLTWPSWTHPGIFAYGCSVRLSRLILCDLKDCGLPGSSVLGISQARRVEWVAISFSSDSVFKIPHNLIMRIKMLAIDQLHDNLQSTSQALFH